jgi:transporter family protein
MDAWVIYAILASLSWGSYIVVNKIAISKGMSPYFALVLMAVGIAGLFLTVFFITKPSIQADSASLTLAVIAGALWALGQLFAILALVNNAPVSKLTPLYNTNTLVALVLGIILLKELPSGTMAIKVAIGAILIVAGGVLVSS